MLTIDTARNIAEEHLAASAQEVKLFHDPIHEGEYGWVFSYQSKQYIRSRSISDALVGNSPLLIDKHTAKLHVLGTGYPVEYYVENYLTFGDPYKVAGPRVELVDWEHGAKKVEAVRKIRTLSGLGLKKAKHAIDECLAGTPVIIECDSDTNAELLVVELNQLGFRARQLSK